MSNPLSFDRAHWRFACAVLLGSVASAQQTSAGADRWPLAPDNVVFAFATALEPIIAFDSATNRPILNYRLENAGFTRIDRAGALQLGHGTATAPGQARQIAERLTADADWTIEAYLTTSVDLAQGGPILSLGDPERPNFELAQDDKRLVFRVRDSETTTTELSVTTSPQAGEGTHIAIASSANELSLYLDGRPVGIQSRDDPPTSGCWSAGPLRFGSGDSIARGWDGVLEGVALHSSLLTPQQIATSHALYQARVAKRAKPERLRVKATLIAKSRVSSADEVAPYRESLCVFEYKIAQVLQGFSLQDKIRIAHWVVLDGKDLPFAQVQVGDSIDLTVEPFAANQQLEKVNIADTLEFDFDLELYYEVGSDSLRWRPGP